MKDIKFVPEEVTAKVGQKIVWTNNEMVPHNVTATDGADFKSDKLDEGDTFEYTPDGRRHDRLRLHHPQRPERLDHRHGVARRPNPRSIMSARAPGVPGLGSTPSWIAVS